MKVGPDKILNQAFEPYKEALRLNFEDGFKKLMEMDKYSTREFLRSFKCVIHGIGLLRTTANSTIGMMANLALISIPSNG